MFIKLNLSLLFVNRNRKATRSYGNCAVKAMSFAERFRVFLTKGKRINRLWQFQKKTET